MKRGNQGYKECLELCDKSKCFNLNILPIKILFYWLLFRSQDLFLWCKSKERAFCQSIKQTRMLEMFLHESISVSVRAFHCIIYIICFISNLFHINCQIENISFTDMPSSLNMFPILEIYDSTKWLCSNNLDGSLHTICKGSYKGRYLAKIKLFCSVQIVLSPRPC